MNGKVAMNGELVALRRTEMGLTQAGFATRVGCCHRTIQRAEKGSKVLLKTAREIAQALGVENRFNTDFEGMRLRFRANLNNGDVVQLSGGNTGGSSFAGLAENNQYGPYDVNAQGEYAWRGNFVGTQGTEAVGLFETYDYIGSFGLKR